MGKSGEIRGNIRGNMEKSEIEFLDLYKDSKGAVDLSNSGTRTRRR
jgi:hypothetical protein